MRIKNIYARRYRSLQRVDVLGCGGLNVFIGRNNSGKSNILSTITFLLKHHSHGSIVAPWPNDRAKNDFTDRDYSTPIEIGIEFELPAALNAELRQEIGKESPHLDASIDQLAAADSLSIVLNGVFEGSTPFVYLRRVSVGHIEAGQHPLGTSGTTILDVSVDAAKELFVLHGEAKTIESDIEALSRAKISEYEFERISTIGASEFLNYKARELRPEIREALLVTIEQAKTSSDVRRAFDEQTDSLAAFRRRVLDKSISSAMKVFAGEATSTPTYVQWLLDRIRTVSFLSLEERRRPIGESEAQTLLELKVRRGGTERLAAVQQIVKGLLGVSIDAFEAETPRLDSRARRTRPVEMDVDNFLAEANGAGIREALRVILDLELQEPELVLIEEPEVHLHPGLEHALYSYLREKSRQTQIFVTTHSTNFVDSISFQNIYLVSREDSTECEAIAEGDATYRIPAELGLRLSTVFMFDRLVFVEGPSDEEVLRELAQKCGLDIAGANVGFVQMGGVRNFAHFAAEGTLDLLARRRIALHFVVDRDEREDTEVQAMAERLGERAKLHVLKRRELENYLLAPAAIRGFVGEKRGLSSEELDRELPEIAEIEAAIADEADALKEEVVRLRVNRQLLRPLFLQVRGNDGTPRELIDSAIEDLQERARLTDETTARIEAEVEDRWVESSNEIAPGHRLLDGIARRFGVRFAKNKGDAVRLARHMTHSDVPREIRQLLEGWCSAGR